MNIKKWMAEEKRLEEAVAKEEKEKKSKTKWGRCEECGKQLTEDDVYGHDCEVGLNIPKETKVWD